MSEVLPDQAAGLRKLLGHEPFRSIAVACAEAGEGSAAVAANLAAALGHQGRDVLLVDCTGGPGGATQILGEGKASGAQVISAQRRGLRVTCLAALDARRLAQSLDRHAGDPDVLLVDAPPGDLACAAAARELILVVSPSASAVTSGYRLLKRLEGQWGRRRVLVLVDRVSCTAQGDRIFGNLSATCRRFLHLPVEYLGSIPDDERIRRAARLRQTVIEAFPESETARALSACAEQLWRSPFPGDAGVVDFAHRLIETVRSPLSSG